MKDERMKMKSFTRMRYCTTTNNIELHRENCSKFSNAVALELGNYLEIQLEFVKFRWHAFRTFSGTILFAFELQTTSRINCVRFDSQLLRWPGWTGRLRSMGTVAAVEANFSPSQQKK
jgi:hypothetical protein